jgi:hypothetical protein
LRLTRGRGDAEKFSAYHPLVLTAPLTMSRFANTRQSCGGPISFALAQPKGVIPLLSLSAEKKGEALPEKDLTNQAKIIRRNASSLQNRGFGIFSRESDRRGIRGFNYHLMKLQPSVDFTPTVAQEVASFTACFVPLTAPSTRS